MTPRTTRRFWDCFKRLPTEVQVLAIEKFRMWQENPYHPSLRFKELSEGVWSVRINRTYRALARRRDDLIIWFWVGSHQDYDRLVGK